MLNSDNTTTSGTGSHQRVASAPALSRAIKLLITVDAEEDDAWGHELPFRTENIAFMPRFQKLCEQFDFKPTWLCTAPILDDPRIVDALGEAIAGRRAEVGIHMHPWSTPPYRNGSGPDPKFATYPHELSIEEFQAKLAYLVHRVRDRFGVSPTSYRAGRWGFAGPQVQPLLQQGLRIDCSVTPHLMWRRHLGEPSGKGGPDFRTAPSTPYWIDPRDVRLPGDSHLLELPMTVLHTGGPFSRWPAAWNLLEPIDSDWAARVFRRLGWSPMTFRPWPGRSAETLVSMARGGVNLGLPYVMVMLHSSELMPGGSPYFPDEASVERLFRVLEELLPALKSAGFEGATLEEFARPTLEARVEKEMNSSRRFG